MTAVADCRQFNRPSDFVSFQVTRFLVIVSIKYLLFPLVVPALANLVLLRFEQNAVALFFSRLVILFSCFGSTALTFILTLDDF